MSIRYALYFAPAPGSELAAFGEAALGRTASMPRSPATAQSPHAQRSRWLSLTQAPAHYGFHATLKAPFSLTAGTSVQALCQQVEQFAQGHSPLLLEGIAPRNLEGFAALTLEPQSVSLNALAQTIVEHFEPFRQVLSTTDYQRRKPDSLSARQHELLLQFGYPYVAEEFRFHMTLSGPLQPSDSDYLEWLNALYEQLITQPPWLDRLAIYTQPNRHSAFVEQFSFPLAG